MVRSTLLAAAIVASTPADVEVLVVVKEAMATSSLQAALLARRAVALAVVVMLALQQAEVEADLGKPEQPAAKAPVRIRTRVAVVVLLPMNAPPQSSCHLRVVQVEEQDQQVSASRVVAEEAPYRSYRYPASRLESSPTRRLTLTVGVEPEALILAEGVGGRVARSCWKHPL